MISNAFKRMRLSSSQSSTNPYPLTTGTGIGSYLSIHMQLETSAQEILDATFEHIENSPNNDNYALEESTSLALLLCKRKVLKPYFRLLSMLGWRPIICPIAPEVSCYAVIFNWVYTVLVTCFILTGYMLQFASCFRQDGYPPYAKGNNGGLVLSKSPTTISHMTMESNYLPPNNTPRELLSSDDSNNNNGNLSQKCSGNFISLYLIPDILHFFAYLFVLQLMRTPECERLQDLLERVFLQTTRFSHKKLVRTLRSFLWLCLAWVTVSIFGHILHIIIFQEINFTWMHPNNKLWVKIMTVLTAMSLTWNDIICAAIVTSYSVHCHLNIIYIRNLCLSIREKKIDFQEFCKRAEDSRKFIDYLNKDQAMGVSLLIVSFGCRAVVAIFGLLSQQVMVGDDPKAAIVVLTSSFLWLSLLSFPIIQAVRLTGSCHSLRDIGHELRARPFGYQDTAQEDLNSLLLYTSSIRMEAKMLYVPMRSSWVLSLLILVIFLILFFGQVGVVKF